MDASGKSVTEMSEENSLEDVMKTFDSQALMKGKGLDLLEESTTGSDGKSISANVLPHVREIIAKNRENVIWVPSISHNQNQKGVMNPVEERLKEENKILKSELDRMEQILTTIMSERDDIAIKYSDMSGRFESTLKTFHVTSGIGGENSDSSDETETSGGSASLLRQNVKLRRLLNEERLEYKRKLQIYQNSQQKHILLVEKLQAKVVHYKKRCTELEEASRDLDIQSVTIQKPFLELQRSHVEQTREIEQLLKKVDEEVHRANDLVHINEVLKEQLDQSNASNKLLSSEIEKLLNLLQDFESKHNEWGGKEEHNNSGHKELPSLRKAVSSIKKDFDTIRIATEKDIDNMTIEMSRTSLLVQDACFEFLENFKNTDLINMKDLDLLFSKRYERESVLEIKRLVAVLFEKDHSINLLEMKVSYLKNQLDSLKNIENLRKSEERNYDCNEKRNMKYGISKSLEYLNCESDYSKSDVDSSNFRKMTQNSSRSHSVSPVRCHGRDFKNHKKKTKKQVGSPLAVFQPDVHKKQMEVFDLKSKLLNVSNQNYNLSRKVENLTADNINMKRNLKVLQEEKRKLLENTTKLENILDQMKMSLNQSNFDVGKLENMKRNLLRQIEQSNEGNKKLLDYNRELHTHKETLENERLELKREKGHLMEEMKRNEESLEECHKKNVKLKEELVNFKEQFHKICLKFEILEQEKGGLENVLMKSTQAKGDMEMNLNKQKFECNILKDALSRLQNLNEDVGCDNADLKGCLKMLESERSILMLEKSSLEEERDHMKEMIHQLESQQIDLLNHKLRLEHENQILNEKVVKLENDFYMLNEQNRHDVDLLKDVIQQKLKTTEECLAIKLECEKHKDLLLKLDKEKEEFVKQKANDMLRISTLEENIKHMNEESLTLKTERENSKLQLEELNFQILSLDNKLTQFEDLKSEMELKMKHLSGETKRLSQEVVLEQERNERLEKLMEEKLDDKEMHHQEVVMQLKSELNKCLDLTLLEKKQMRENFEKDYAELHKKSMEEKNEIVMKLEKEKEKLKEEVCAIKRLKEQQLLVADHEKQELIGVNEEDRSKLLETVLMQQKEVMDVQNLFGKLKTEKEELEVKCCHHENTISQLGSELKLAKTSFDKARLTFARNLEELKDGVEMLTLQKKNLEFEVNNLNTQLKLSMDSKNLLKSELHEIRSNITKIESDKEISRKEALKLMLLLREEQYENKMLTKMMDDLKNTIKQLEAKKLDLNKIIIENQHQVTGLKEEKMMALKDADKLRESLNEFEKGHVVLKKELQDARSHLKVLELEKLKLSHEVADYISKHDRASIKLEEMKKEILFLKQKVSETEDSGESLKKENYQLRRCLEESEKEIHFKCEELKRLEEDADRTKVNAGEERNKIEMSLENLKGNISDLDLKYKSSQTMMRHYEEKTKAIELEKMEMESKLNSLIATALRNFAQGNPKVRARSSSSSKRRGRSVSSGGIGYKKRNRSYSPRQINLLNVDIEDVKSVMREFAQTAMVTEREKDKAFTKLTEVLMNHERLVSKFELIASSLDYSQREKKDLENKVVGLQLNIMQFENSLRKEGENNKHLAERVVDLETTLRSLDRERSQLQDKISDMKKSEEKWENEKHQYNCVIEDTETKVISSESERRVLEAELYKMKMVLSKKETEYQIVSNRKDQLQQQVEDLEGRMESYRTTIARLNSDLIRCSEEKTSYIDQVNVLNVSLSGKSDTVDSLQEKLMQLQRTLAYNEQDKRMLQESLDNSRQSLEETKRQLHFLQEKIGNMMLELKENESRRIELEAECNMFQHLQQVHAKRVEQEQYLNEELSLLQGENKDLQQMVFKLQRTMEEMKVDIVEAEVSAVRLKKDRTTLKRSLNKSEEFLNKTFVERTQMETVLKKLEDDNHNLLQNLESLQKRLTISEQEHKQRLAEMVVRHNEMNLELERLLSAKIKAEKLLDLQERNHRHTVNSLKDQVSALKEKLDKELKLKRHYQDSNITHFPDDCFDSRQIFDISLKRTNNEYFDKPTKRGTSPAKVTSALVTRHISPTGQKKPIRSGSRK